MIDITTTSGGDTNDRQSLIYLLLGTLCLVGALRRAWSGGRCAAALVLPVLFSAVATTVFVIVDVEYPRLGDRVDARSDSVGPSQEHAVNNRSPTHFADRRLQSFWVARSTS
jgi:hypothetical protein